MNELDKKYLEIFLSPLYVCSKYLPAFGTSGNDGLTLADFQLLYGSDEFYSWIGLDSPLVYAAHKASGGLTSIYRQIGVGAERLLREIIKDGFALSQEQVEWKYEYNKTKRQKAFHILDARISLENIKSVEHVERMKQWLAKACKAAQGDSRTHLNGAIFEIRQGYKSADSKACCKPTTCNRRQGRFLTGHSICRPVNYCNRCRGVWLHVTRRLGCILYRCSCVRWSVAGVLL